eukprot:jgi/Astpho2/1704/Aster-x0491
MHVIHLGKLTGLTLLDTGASGGVIEMSVADELGLAGFGELYVAGMSGTVRSQFRRGTTLSLGPLTIQNPVFMEMPIDGVVKGAPGRVVGILGYNLLRRAVVELPPQLPTQQHVRCTIKLHDPERYRASSSLKQHWLQVVFLSNLPLIDATFQAAEGQPEQQQFFMLDSGAGGVDCIFHGRAVEELNLLKSSTSSKSLRGVGGTAMGSTQVIELGTVQQDVLLVFYGGC